MKIVSITLFAILAILVLWMSSTANAQSPPTPRPVDRVRFFPAPGFERAMVGGSFLGSNGPDLPSMDAQGSAISLTGFKILTSIEKAPDTGQWTELQFTNSTPYRWLAYAAPPGSHGKVAEIEFYAGEHKLAGRPFNSFSPHGASRRATDGDIHTIFDGHDPDGQFAGLDVGIEATGPTPRMTPEPGEFDTAQTVALGSSRPGSTVRYTLNGTLPSMANGFTYREPIPVAATTTVCAVAFNDGLAPTPPAVGSYIIGPGVRSGSLHIGNSLTQLASGFNQHALSAGLANNGFICGIGGAKTKKLWEATTSTNNPDYQLYKRLWDKAWASLGQIDNFTMQPRDFDVAEEADYDIRFMNLVRTKSPKVQPWLYIEWTEMDRKRPTDVGTQASGEMQKVWPALTWEESMAAMVLYGEDLQRQILKSSRQDKQPRVLPTALALGWLHRFVEEGKFSGVAPGEFYPKLFRDDVHLNSEGSFLVECTWFSAFFGQSPAGKFLPTRTNLTTAQANLMQNLAWDVIENYPDCGIYKEGTTPTGMPQFSPLPARVNQVTQVTLASSTPGAWFRYTLDGTPPGRTRGYVYCGVISVRPGMTVRAVAYKSGMSDSSVAEATY